MYKNSSAPSNNIALWHYLGTKHLDFRHENTSTPCRAINRGNIVFVLSTSYILNTASLHCNS